MRTLGHTSHQYSYLAYSVCGSRPATVPTQSKLSPNSIFLHTEGQSCMQATYLLSEKLARLEPERGQA